MIFDESIRIPPLWISKETLDYLNKNREEVSKKGTKNAKGAKKRGKQAYTVKTEENEENQGFCHQ